MLDVPKSHSKFGSWLVFTVLAETALVLLLFVGFGRVDHYSEMQDFKNLKTPLHTVVFLCSVPIRNCHSYKSLSM
jgi:hypothetical protein